MGLVGAGWGISKIQGETTQYLINTDGVRRGPRYERSDQTGLDKSFSGKEKSYPDRNVCQHTLEREV